ncbi:unnamed protein product [Ectocarpus sp. CCAP 1310/34]|nr:unnamed protein product [Ectocarpus sp. CCAP 1310/34]
MVATAFMTTSQPRCRRRSSGLFLALAKNHLLRLAVVVLMTMVLLTASVVADPPRPGARAGRWCHLRPWLFGSYERQDARAWLRPHCGRCSLRHD